MLEGDLLRKTIRNRICVILLAVFMFISAFFSFGFMRASADTKTVNFDNTNVLDDLRSSRTFNILNYPFYKSDTPEMAIMNVVEYCYSFDVFRQEDYGLYLYVYNPNGRNINTSDGD